MEAGRYGEVSVGFHCTMLFGGGGYGYSHTNLDATLGCLTLNLIFLSLCAIIGTSFGFSPRQQGFLLPSKARFARCFFEKK